MLLAVPVMPERTRMPALRLTLESRLDDLAQVHPWIEALARAYAIPEDAQFAIDLCLEEALSNVIRHGYRGQPGHPIAIEFAVNENGVAFSVEDQAPPFDPLAYSPADTSASLEDFQSGGQGIRLLRKFASHLAYERLAAGNRLTISFAFPR